MFLTFQRGEFAKATEAVNPNVGGARYFFDVVQALDHRGLIQAEFFDRLAAERPERATEIVSLAGYCLGEGETSWEWHGGPTQPCNLPLVSIGPLFKGREAFLDDLRQRLGAHDRRATAIVGRQAIHGLGGVGKTRAAVEYAWQHADDYTALLFIS